jgi:hypothetical protein
MTITLTPPSDISALMFSVYGLRFSPLTRRHAVTIDVANNPSARYMERSLAGQTVPAASARFSPMEHREAIQI